MYIKKLYIGLVAIGSLLLMINYFILNKYVSNRYKLGFNDGKLHTQNKIINQLSQYFKSTNKANGTVIFSFKTTDVVVLKEKNRYTLKIVR